LVSFHFMEPEIEPKHREQHRDSGYYLEDCELLEQSVLA